ncbi:MAG: MotA/TolQ/ExbB proton channel family protein [Myxococcota bacterium]
MDKANQAMEFTIGGLWDSMGLFAKLIVIVLLLMSVLSMVVMVERLLLYIRTKKESQRFAGDVAAMLEARDLRGTLEKAKLKDVGYLGRVIRAGLASWKAAEHEDEDLAFESVMRALERQTQREVHTLRRGLSMLASVSSLAPFVGLLGTVVGIVNSFSTMAEKGSGGLAVVSAGVAEALVTTATGLFVAIPALAVFNAMQGWVDARGVDMAESGNELLDVVARVLTMRDGHLMTQRAVREQAAAAVAASTTT